MFGEHHQIAQADAFAPRTSLHGHIYRPRPNGLETLKDSPALAREQTGASIRPCPDGRTYETAGTTLMERANSELALRRCHHADRLRRTLACELRAGVRRRQE